MKEHVNIGKVVSIAGAFVGYCIGAAFASGQEVLQFFTAYGFWGILGAFISSGLYIYMCISFLLAGTSMPEGNGNEIYKYYAGEKLGRILEWYSILLLYIILIIMFSGSGAVFSQYYGLPALWGRLTMVVLVVLAVLFGLDRLVKILAPLGSLVIIGCVSVAALGIWKNGDHLSAAQSFTENSDILKISGSFWISGILHASFMAVLIAVFTASLGTTVANKREAKMAGLLGGLVFGIGILLVLLVELAYIEQIAFSDVPMLFIAKELGIPGIALLFSFILLAGIFTTSAPLLWSISVRFTKDKSPQYRLLSLVIATTAFLVSYMPFQNLINMIFPTLGYAGILFLLLMIGKQLKRDKPIV